MSTLLSSNQLVFSKSLSRSQRRKLKHKQRRQRLYASLELLRSTQPSPPTTTPPPSPNNQLQINLWLESEKQFLQTIQQINNTNTQPSKMDTQPQPTQPIASKSIAIEAKVEGKRREAVGLMEAQRRAAKTSGEEEFGTERDKNNCPFYLKTGACMYGEACSRRHWFPHSGPTLLLKNLYDGPGLFSVPSEDDDDDLQYDDDELQAHYDAFFEDVYPEFERHGRLVAFKVCRNCASHLRGNGTLHTPISPLLSLTNQSICTV